MVYTVGHIDLRFQFDGVKSVNFTFLHLEFKSSILIDL